MTTHSGSVTESANAQATVDAQVIRGPASWTYIYVALGFTFAIEGTVIQMITPLLFPWNLVAYAVVGTLTFWLFLSSGWFQNKLLDLKQKYEGKPR